MSAFEARARPDDRAVLATHLLGDPLHSGEITRTGEGEPRFDDIHTEPRQLLGNGQLFLQVEARPGRLLTIPQSGVKNQDATGVLGHGRGSSGGLSRNDYELTHPSSAPEGESD